MLDELISVIIPVFNVADDLGRCIGSVTEQTYRNIEILLIDDGSFDGSEKICEEYAGEDERIRVYHKKNGGLSSARNMGIQKAGGSILAFVDSDDCIHSRMMEILYRNLCSQDADISVGEYRRVREGGIVTENDGEGKVICKSPEEALTFLLGNDTMFNTGVVCNKLFRRNLFDGIKFPDGRLHEDEFVIHYLLGRARRVVYTSDVLYYYFVREESITGQYSRKRLDVLDAYEDRFQYCLKRNFTALASGSFRRYLYIIRINYYAYRKHYPKDHDVIKKLRKRHADAAAGQKRTVPARIFDLSPGLHYILYGMLKLKKGRGYIWE